MIHSEDLAELFTALAAFQSEVEAIPKTEANPFFKSRFAPLPDVVAAASPLLTANGLSVTQLLGHDEGGDTLTTIVGHKSGQFIGDTMHLRPVKDDPQAQGSATTYGRRYAYMAALGLVADEDDDGNSASRRQSKPTPKPKASPKPKPAPKPADDPQVEAAKATLDAEEVIDAEHVAHLSRKCKAAGWSRDRVILTLIGIEGVGDIDDTDKGEPAATIKCLTVPQALEFEAEIDKDGAS